MIQLIIRFIKCEKSYQNKQCVLTANCTSNDNTYKFAVFIK